MNTAARAIACTATGAHSFLPLWSWLPGMLSVETTAEHRLRRRRVLQVSLADHWGSLVPFIQLELDGWRPLSNFHALPDFTDMITLHGLHALVIRAWTGHEIKLTTNVLDGRCMRHNIRIIAPGGKRVHADGNHELDALLVGALEATPTRTA